MKSTLVKDLVSKIWKCWDRQRKILLRSCRVKLHLEISLVSNKSESNIFTKLLPGEDLGKDLLSHYLAPRSCPLYWSMYSFTKFFCSLISISMVRVNALKLHFLDFGIFLDYFFVTYLLRTKLPNSIDD